ncbi:hypothetical protein [Atopobium fossor]|uniref:hypothetical protein n=1 Tax=Atopobium fossor TaxID=39487 RepID=UPI00041D17E9|nr:hypothetical protein [Atopobium fossor]
MIPAAKMKKRANILLVAGLIALAAGMGISVFKPNPQQDNLRIAQNAQNAEKAALAISANNRSDLFGTTLGNGFLGFGIATTVGSLVIRVIASKKEQQE